MQCAHKYLINLSCVGGAQWRMTSGFQQHKYQQLLPIFTKLPSRNTVYHFGAKAIILSFSRHHRRARNGLILSASQINCLLALWVYDNLVQSIIGLNRCQMEACLIWNNKSLDWQRVVQLFSFSFSVWNRQENVTHQFCCANSEKRRGFNGFQKNCKMETVLMSQ